MPGLAARVFGQRSLVAEDAAEDGEIAQRLLNTVRANAARMGLAGATPVMITDPGRPTVKRAGVRFRWGTNPLVDATVAFPSDREMVGIMRTQPSFVEETMGALDADNATGIPQWTNYRARALSPEWRGAYLAAIAFDLATGGTASSTLRTRGDAVLGQDWGVYWSPRRLPPERRGFFSMIDP